MTNLFESIIHGAEKKAAQVGGAISDEAHKMLSAAAAPIESAAHSAQMQAAGLLPHLSLTGGHDGHSPPQARDNKAHASDSTAHTQDKQHGHLLNNLLDIGGTIATGIGEDVKRDIKVVGEKVHGAVEATEKAAVDTGTWIGHHPVESALIAAGAVAIVATGGLAAPVIAETAVAVGAAVSAAAESAGLAGVVDVITDTVGTAVPRAASWLAKPIVQQGIIGLTAIVPAAGTYHAARETLKNGELKVLMNEQNESPEAVAKAREQLKHDTGHAAVNDGIFAASLGVGWVGAKAFQAAPKIMDALFPAKVAKESGEAPGALAPLTTEAIPHTETVPAAAEAKLAVAEAAPAPAANPTRNLKQRIAAIAEGLTGDVIQAVNNCGMAYTTAGKILHVVPRYPVAAPDIHTIDSTDEPNNHKGNAAHVRSGSTHGADAMNVPDEATHFTLPELQFPC